MKTEFLISYATPPPRGIPDGGATENVSTATTKWMSFFPLQYSVSPWNGLCKNCNANGDRKMDIMAVDDGVHTVIATEKQKRLIYFAVAVAV